MSNTEVPTDLEPTCSFCGRQHHVTVNKPDQEALAPLDVEALAAELCVNRQYCEGHRAQAVAAIDAIARLTAREKVAR